MTVVIVGTPDLPVVVALTECLRRRGFTALALSGMGLVALVMLTERVVAVIVPQDQAPPDWESTRDRLAEIGPNTRILFVARDDRRTPDELASHSVSHLEA